MTQKNEKESFRFKIGKFFDRLLGWHKPDEKIGHSFDGVSFHAVCKYCHKPIMLDSQGNWF